MITAPKDKLVIISYRAGRASFDGSGGLTKMLKQSLPDYKDKYDVYIVGTSGRIAENVEDSRIKNEHDPETGINFVSMDATAAEQKAVYEDRANKVIWPASHGLTDDIEYTPDDGVEAQKFYRRLADATTTNIDLGKRDLILVQDYQLAPLGEELRAENCRGQRIESEISFNLHIPMISNQYLADAEKAGKLDARAIRKDYVRPMFAYDNIYMQRPSDAEALASHTQKPKAKQFFEPYKQTFVHNRPVIVNPVGIDIEKHNEEARIYKNLPEVRAIKDQYLQKNANVSMTVGRQDPAKGFVKTFEAAIHLAQHNPDTLKNLRLVHFGGQTRKGMPIYDQYAEAMVRTANDLNDIAHKVGLCPNDEDFIELRGDVHPNVITGISTIGDDLAATGHHAIAMSISEADGYNLGILELLSGSRNTAGAVSATTGISEYIPAGGVNVAHHQQYRKGDTLGQLKSREEQASVMAQLNLMTVDQVVSSNDRALAEFKHEGQFASARWLGNQIARHEAQKLQRSR